MNNYKILNLPQSNCNYVNTEIHESVYLHSSNYSKIFGSTLGTNLQMRGVVKIVYIDKNKRRKSIYRLFASKGIKDLRDQTIGLSHLSCQYLGIGDEEPANLILKKGSKLLFYWYHPLHEVRIAYKLGALSLLLGLISILISMVPFI
jgi:hypothetical protein